MVDDLWGNSNNAFWARNLGSKLPSEGRAIWEQFGQKLNIPKRRTGRRGSLLTADKLYVFISRPQSSGKQESRVRLQTQSLPPLIRLWRRVIISFISLSNSSPDAGFLLAKSDHVTWILASDWSRSVISHKIFLRWAIWASEFWIF